MRQKKPALSPRKSESAAKEEEPFEGKQIGRADPSFRGAEQQGPGMNKGRGAAGPQSDE